MDMETRHGESRVLVAGQQWKLWLAGAMLAIAGAGFLMPEGIGNVLAVPGVAVELGALMLCFVGMAWAVYAVRCRHCGMRLVLYAMTHQSIGQWLHWLLAVKRCPRCGTDH